MVEQEGGNTWHRVGSFMDEEMKLVAIQKLHEFEAHSNLPSPYASGTVAPLDWTNLQVGSFLGSGTFAAVYKVQVVGNAPQHLMEPQNEKYHKSEKDNADATTFAIKVLRPDLATTTNRGELLAGAVDLAIEARILASLQHENIVRLHGVSSSSFAESIEACDDFLVEDYLVQTLAQYIIDKRLEQKHQQRKWYMVTDRIALTIPKRRRNCDAASIHRRLQTIAVGIARAMEYMHSHGILFRDLKPTNVGFDARGRVKIFDLGLARPLHCINMRAVRPVGSPRYMAPEVAKCEPYGLSADVYSFGILLWETCTLQKPFANISVSSQLRQRVALDHERPSLKDVGHGHRLLKMLLQGCWHDSPRCRPSFTTVLSELSRMELQERQGLNLTNNGVLEEQAPLKYLFPTRRAEGQSRRRNVMQQLWRKASLTPSRQEEEEVVFNHSKST